MRLEVYFKTRSIAQHVGPWEAVILSANKENIGQGIACYTASALDFIAASSCSMGRCEAVCFFKTKLDTSRAVHVASIFITL